MVKDIMQEEPGASEAELVTTAPEKGQPEAEAGASIKSPEEIAEVTYEPVAKVESVEPIGASEAEMLPEVPTVEDVEVKTPEQMGWIRPAPKPAPAPKPIITPEPALAVTKLEPKPIISADVMTPEEMISDKPTADQAHMLGIKPKPVKPEIPVSVTAQVKELIAQGRLPSDVVVMPPEEGAEQLGYRYYSPTEGEKTIKAVEEFTVAQRARAREIADYNESLEQQQLAEVAGEVVAATPTDTPEEWDIKKRLQFLWGTVGNVVDKFRTKEVAQATVRGIKPTTERVSKQIISEVRADPGRYVTAAVMTFTPGLYTATNWNNLTTSEKMFSMSVDLAIAGGLAMSWATLAPYGSQFSAFGRGSKQALSSATKEAGAAERAAIAGLRKQLTAAETREANALIGNVRKALASGQADDVMIASERMRALPEVTKGKISPQVADDLANKVRQNGLDSLNAQDKLYTDWLRRNPRSAKRTVVAELQKINKRQLKTLVKEQERPLPRIQTFKEFPEGKYLPARAVSPALARTPTAPALKGFTAPAARPLISTVRPTAAQAAKSAGIESEYIEAIGKPIPGTKLYVIGKGQTAIRISEDTRTKLAELTEQAVRAANEAMQRGQPAAQVQTQLQKQLQLQLKALPQLQTKTSLQLQTKTMTKLATKLAAPVRTRVTRDVRVKTIIKPRKDSTGEELYSKDGAITWKQGLFWVVIKYPYRSKADVAWQKQRPTNAHSVDGAGSAYLTIQRLTGKAPDSLILDMGIMDVHVSNRARAIKFKRDKRQRTTGDISLKLSTIRR